MEVPSSWDALRKQARKLEAQLDEQMNSYRRVVSTKVTTKNDTSENDLESGIDRLLKQLQQVNSQMQAWVSSGGSEMVSHTLTRHQEILQDLTQEFYRLRSSLRAKQEHASLLEDFREFDRTRLDLEEGAGSAEQALLKENASISRSTGQAYALTLCALRLGFRRPLRLSALSAFNNTDSGEGTRICFWHDRWIGDNTLKDLYPASAYPNLYSSGCEEGYSLLVAKGDVSTATNVAATTIIASATMTVPP
ncbi:hypothetical protein SO802_005963 [Lithocarpus litseifolius]|uniref:Golgi SNAP receptor complex member 1 n=1 Tax=Lithocarpus litseifolius TaxID=425828 RepID=A0AAW2DNS6_9ROSI